MREWPKAKGKPPKPALSRRPAIWVESTASQAAIDPRHEGAAVDRFVVAPSAEPRRLPNAKILVELSELVAQPKEADALVELGVGEFFFQIKLYRVGSAVGERPVRFDRSRLGRAAHHE